MLYFLFRINMENCRKDVDLRNIEVFQTLKVGTSMKHSEIIGSYPKKVMINSSLINFSGTWAAILYIFYTQPLV